MLRRPLKPAVLPPATGRLTGDAAPARKSASVVAGLSFSARRQPDFAQRHYATDRTDAMQEHIFAAFDRDLEGIQATIMKMGGLVECAIHDGALSLVTRDPELADRVLAGDAAIDALDTSLTEEAARVIALRSPSDIDLRDVLSVMRISANLEQIGDLAKAMAKQTHALVGLPDIAAETKSLRRMARDIEGMLKDALDSFVQRDATLAGDVIERDRDVDLLFNTLFRELLTFMLEDPRNVAPCMHLHFIAKTLERMGDHITAICRQVIHLTSAATSVGVSAKADRTSRQDGL